MRRRTIPETSRNLLIRYSFERSRARDSFGVDSSLGGNTGRDFTNHPGNEARTYAALVIVAPGSSVKEQVGAVWGNKMAERGFIALAYDPSYQGESGGEPRDLEDPAARVEDVRCAVDYLMTLPYVGEERVGVLGIARAAATR